MINYSDAYQALLDGRGDAFSTDNTEVLAWALESKGFEVGITSLGDPDTIAPAVQKGNTEAAQLHQRRNQRTRQRKLLPQGL